MIVVKAPCHTQAQVDGYCSHGRFFELATLEKTDVAIELCFGEVLKLESVFCEPGPKAHQAVAICSDRSRGKAAGTKSVEEVVHGGDFCAIGVMKTIGRKPGISSE